MVDDYLKDPPKNEGEFQSKIWVMLCDIHDKQGQTISRINSLDEKNRAVHKRIDGGFKRLERVENKIAFFTAAKLSALAFCVAIAAWFGNKADIIKHGARQFFNNIFN